MNREIGDLWTKQAEVPHMRGDEPSRRIGAYVDPDSGTVVKTGAGWAYNPGKNSLAWAEGMDLGGRVPGQKTWPDFGFPQKLTPPSSLEPEMIEALPTQAEAAKATAKTLGMKDTEDFIFIKTADNDRVMVRRNRIPHVVEKRGNESRERYANFIRPTLEDPNEVWLTAFEGGPAKQYVRTFPNQKGLMVSVQVNHDGSILWNVINTKSSGVNRFRVGYPLYVKK